MFHAKVREWKAFAAEQKIREFYKIRKFYYEVDDLKNLENIELN